MHNIMSCVCAPQAHRGHVLLQLPLHVLQLLDVIALQGPSVSDTEQRSMATETRHEVVQLHIHAHEVLLVPLAGVQLRVAHSGHREARVSQQRLPSA